MRARLNGTKDPFVEITEVSLANKPYVVYSADRIEFEQEKTQQEPTLDHWQDVRERAVIAVMQGLLSNPKVTTDNIERDTYRGLFIEMVIKVADALVKKLKGE